MIRIAVDDAIDDIIESGINERETDIEAIKEKIFLEVASRLEEAKLSSQVRLKLNDSTERKKNASFRDLKIFTQSQIGLY